MIRKAIVTGSIFAALAIVLGAFGAHALEQHGGMTPHNTDVYETATRYQFYHALALVMVGILIKLFGESKFLSGAYSFMTVGVILFSGSLYLLSTAGVTGINFNWMGPVTPIGGLFLITGWILIVISFIKNKSSQSA